MVLNTQSGNIYYMINKNVSCCCTVKEINPKNDTEHSVVGVL